MTIGEASHGAPGAVEHAGPVRVDLLFEPGAKRVRVPQGVTLFDAASWNGIAIDSTCGGHGTCKKCRVRVLNAPGPASALDARAFTPAELADGWRLACRALASTGGSCSAGPRVRREPRRRSYRPPGAPENSALKRRESRRQPEFAYRNGVGRSPILDSNRLQQTAADLLFYHTERIFNF